MSYMNPYSVIRTVTPSNKRRVIRQDASSHDELNVRSRITNNELTRITDNGLTRDELTVTMS